jgi:hypothetical protein
MSAGGGSTFRVTVYAVGVVWQERAIWALWGVGVVVAAVIALVVVPVARHPRPADKDAKPQATLATHADRS